MGNMPKLHFFCVNFVFRGAFVCFFSAKKLNFAANSVVVLSTFCDAIAKRIYSSHQKQTI